ncbi:MAG TPA: alpha/beta hydrolase family protein [Xanthobacteraceae bacterium]|nr:alpha/beta hydrolase family protein [Xanthobacteraceae bacterium]
MGTYVLVHGAWHGAWCWKRVARLLRADGHDVYTPTLTGVGERAHHLRPGIDLDTHIMDVVNEIRWQELSDVVLVGHSYAGVVVSGAAEHVGDAIGSIVLLDAFYTESGQALIDLQPPAARDAFMAAQAKGEIAMAPRPAAMFHVNADDAAWVDRMCVPHPINCFTQPLTMTGARERIARKAYVRASAYPSVPFDQSKQRAAANGWRTYDIPCGHDVMLDMPERLAEVLREVA